MLYFISNFVTTGELAQLARASALHAGGQGFESLILHQFDLNIEKMFEYKLKSCVMVKF